MVARLNGVQKVVSSNLTAPTITSSASISEQPFEFLAQPDAGEGGAAVGDGVGRGFIAGVQGRHLRIRHILDAAVEDLGVVQLALGLWALKIMFSQPISALFMKR